MLIVLSSLFKSLSRSLTKIDVHNLLPSTSPSATHQGVMLSCHHSCRVLPPLILPMLALGLVLTHPIAPQAGTKAAGPRPSSSSR